MELLLNRLQRGDVLALCDERLSESTQDARGALVTEVQLGRAARAEGGTLLGGVRLEGRRALTAGSAPVVAQSPFDVPDGERAQAPAVDNGAVLGDLLQQLPPSTLEDAIVEREVQDGICLSGAIRGEAPEQRRGDVGLADAGLEGAAVGRAAEEADPEPPDGWQRHLFFCGSSSITCGLRIFGRLGCSFCRRRGAGLWSRGHHLRRGLHSPRGCSGQASVPGGHRSPNGGVGR
mmetsp:Transcript_52814/g.138541  ORF Transcript_52814/g.138541 Transcript_52814/m.138541 type:complete len:234 (-) Transcript_52814:36-737(-)